MMVQHDKNNRGKHNNQKAMAAMMVQHHKNNRQKHRSQKAMAAMMVQHHKNNRQKHNNQKTMKDKCICFWMMNPIMLKRNLKKTQSELKNTTANEISSPSNRRLKLQRLLLGGRTALALPSVVWHGKTTIKFNVISNHCQN